MKFGRHRGNSETTIVISRKQLNLFVGLIAAALIATIFVVAVFFNYYQERAQFRTNQLQDVICRLVRNGSPNDPDVRYVREMLDCQKVGAYGSPTSSRTVPSKSGVLMRPSEFNTSASNDVSGQADQQKPSSTRENRPQGRTTSSRTSIERARTRVVTKTPAPGITKTRTTTTTETASPGLCSVPVLRRVVCP